MSKPRFPLSVERYFSFRSRILATGEILECDTFKALYYHTRKHLRSESDTNRCLEAVLEFGYITTYEIRKGYWYTEWTLIEDFGCMQISADTESFYRTSDEANHIIRGEVIL